MRKLLFSAAIATGLAFTVNYYAQASGCTNTYDCSTEGKKPKKWCESGSGNCLCTLIVNCPQQ